MGDVTVAIFIYSTFYSWQPVSIMTLHSTERITVNNKSTVISSESQETLDLR